MMKTLKISILLVALVGFVATQTECKDKTATNTAKKKNSAQEKSVYDQLQDQYNALVKSFDKLEAQRAEYEAKNPSRDEMAKLDVQIADIREKADALYVEMGEFPQFSTYKGETIPESPKYMPTDKEYKECIIKSKELNKEIKKLTKTVSKK